MSCAISALKISGDGGISPPRLSRECVRVASNQRRTRKRIERLRARCEEREGRPRRRPSASGSCARKGGGVRVPPSAPCLPQGAGFEDDGNQLPSVRRGENEE